MGGRLSRSGRVLAPSRRSAILDRHERSEPFVAKTDRVPFPDFNRGRVPPASIAVDLCTGSVYAWRIFNPPLVKLHGVVANALARLVARPHSGA